MPDPISKMPSQQLKMHISRQVSGLLRQYHDNTPRGVATLAQLRRIDDRDPVLNPEVSGLVLADFPIDLSGQGDELSRAELAALCALHLFAIHQQGRPDSMHKSSERFGAAVRTLALRRGIQGTPDEATVSRFNRLCRASTHTTRARQLRGLVQQMRGENIALDYGQLASDVFDLLSPSSRSRVHLRWARDFHHSPSRPSGEAAAPTAPQSPAEYQTTQEPS